MLRCAPVDVGVADGNSNPDCLVSGTLSIKAAKLRYINYQYTLSSARRRYADMQAKRRHPPSFGLISTSGAIQRMSSDNDRCDAIHRRDLTRLLVAISLTLSAFAHEIHRHRFYRVSRTYLEIASDMSDSNSRLPYAPPAPLAGLPETDCAQYTQASSLEAE